jgi:PAS domain S-box-containing protein
LADEPNDQPDPAARITTAADEQFWRRVRQSWHRLGDTHTTSRETPAQTFRPEVQDLIDAIEVLRARESRLQLQNQQLNEALGELRAERQRYRDLFEYAPDAYVVTDRAGIIHTANRAAARLFVRTSDRLRGESIERYLPGAARVMKEHAAFIKRQDEPHTPTEWSATVRADDGRDVAVGVRLANANGASADVRWLIRTTATR